MERQTYSFSIRKKLVLGVSGLAIVTFGFSAVFIFFLAEYLENLFGFNQSTIIALTLLKGIFWSAVIGYVAAPLITKPIREVEEAARRGAQGQIERDITVSKSDDEIRALGLAYNEMQKSLREIVRDINDNFNHTNEKVTELTSVSEIAATKADQIGEMMDEIAKGAESSAVAIQRTAESMEEVTQIALNVQSRANRSKTSSDEMVQTLTESRKVVHTLVKGIKQLAKDNEESLTAVSRLRHQAKEVGDIILVVGDIAAQTNLLALNASIEAARAGEQGRGFAVVADEVRNLADESAKAVENITELIHSMQAEVRNVVEQIGDQVTKALEKSEQGTKTNKAIEHVEKSVHEVAETIEHISSMIDQQMDSIQKTSQQSQEVAAVAQETSAGSLEISSLTEEQGKAIGEVANKAKELSEQAGKLKQTIERFTI